MFKRRIEKKISGPCYFCQEKKEPGYKNIADLEKFTTDWGQIIARAKTGVCQKHQRRLAQSIKRARFLALMTFVSQI